MSDWPGQGSQAQGADATAGRWLSILRTLAFVTNGPDVLLMKRGPHRRIFPGLYNGLGGHLERGEDIYSGAIREIHEESGLAVHNVRLRGISTIDVKNAAGTGITVFVFTAESLSRQVSESDEGTLHWVPIPLAETLPLVEDLSLLLPRLFGPSAQGRDPGADLFFAQVQYDANDRLVMTFADSI